MNELTLLAPDERDIGDFSVRRVLPSAQRRAVGPFVFFDHFGPVRFAPGKGMDVRPHPHIGLATVTYLFDGEIIHRDSLGEVQAIRPGGVNWMTAGRGIVHSERSDAEARKQPQSLHGLQIWLGLPEDAEEVEPEFHHHPADTIPAFERDDARLRLIAGEALGHASPVRTFSPLFYLDVRLPAGGCFVLPAEYPERAVYTAVGSLRVAGEEVPPCTMALLPADGAVTVEALDDAVFAVLGGEPIGRRHIWWNFVSSSRERIQQAADDWREGRFPVVPGETEFIPLPDP